MFDIGSPARGLIVQAIVAFAERQEATWPFDALNDMLGLFYNKDGPLDTPQIYAIIESGRTVGYLTMPLNSYSPRELNVLFWQAMLDTGSAVKTSNGYEFKADPPFATLASTEAGVVSVLAYQQPSGAGLPTEAINYALRMLLGQSAWPTHLAPFLYPVAKNGSPLLAGIWVAPSVDDLNTDNQADDAVFRAVRTFNNPGEAPLRGRLAAHAALRKALSEFQDFSPKEF